MTTEDIVQKRCKNPPIDSVYRPPEYAAPGVSVWKNKSILGEEYLTIKIVGLNEIKAYKY